MKKTHGITLIALVITIIVLLILAGITINLTLGQDGIIKHAKTSGEEYEKSQLKEELELAILDIKADKLSKGQEMKREDLAELSKIGATMQNFGIPAEGEYKDYFFEVDENYIVTIIGKLKGEKPNIQAEILNNGIVQEDGKVEIKVTASITEGKITSLEATNGAVLKTETSQTEKIFEVSANGTYYFKTTADNGRSATISIEVNTINILNILKAGDYIKYDSGKNGVITCRVLYPVNSEHGLQIISDKNVKNVILGSEVYSETIASYNNAIVTLNNEAENYINTEYAYDARCVGSAPTIQNGMFINKDKVKFEGTEEYIVPSNENYYQLPFANSSYINSFDTDINYETDYNAMKAATSQGSGIDVTGEHYWLASRAVSEISLFSDFDVRFVYPNGESLKQILSRVETDGDVLAFAYGNGLRPCISLKSDIIKITGGDGKSADTAYVIGK